MDGNNRWSKKNNKDKRYSYKKGANNLLKLSDYLFNRTNIRYISAFALSSHNLKRSKALIFLIKELLNEFVNEELKKDKYYYGINFIGDLNFLDKDLILSIDLLEKKTSSYPKKINIFINYTGQNDLARCIDNIVKFNLKVTKKNISNNLYTNKIPDPSILIRTGGYKRLSDFMLYQLSFTELFFTKKLWPDFSINDLEKIILEYSNIDRKFGL